MPKKKQRAPVKEKKGKKKAALNERELLSYEQQIADKNRQLTRLQNRNEELENDVKSMKLKLEQLEADHSDVIAYLKRNLEEKTTEAEELNEQLLALEETRKLELTAYERKEKSMESAYETMKNNLNAELKLAVGKLNGLEDWRIARLDLLRKFEKQELFLKEQEEHYKELLHQTERKVINKKSRMKEEMVKRLNELAESFQETANIYIADATARAIQENILLNKSLNDLQNLFRESRTTIQEFKDYQCDLQLRSELLDVEAKYAITKTFKQDRAIVELANRYISMHRQYYNEQRLNMWYKKSDTVVEELKRTYKRMEERNEILQKRLREIQENYKQVTSYIGMCYKKCRKLCTILSETKRCIEETLQLQNDESPDSICTFCNDTIKEVMLRSLLNILGSEDLEDILKYEDVVNMLGLQSKLEVSEEITTEENH